MIIHIALEFSKLENAQAVLEELFGMKLLRSFNIEERLSQALFEKNPPENIMLYGKDSMAIEAFIDKNIEISKKYSYGHLCMAVENMGIFIDKCNSLGLKIMQYRKDERLITFMQDKDKNLYEIKEKTS